MVGLRLRWWKAREWDLLVWLKEGKGDGGLGDEVWSISEPKKGKVKKGKRER